MTPQLVVTGVRREFRESGARAVHDLSLTVGKGEIVALVGPSGCGKTTTLRLVAGFERPDAGSIAIAGTCVADANGAFVPPERRHVGVVFQDFALFPHLTVGGNVGFGLSANAGRGARYTRVRLPVRLVYVEPQPDRGTAMKRERAIKALPRTRKRKLISA